MAVSYRVLHQSKDITLRNKFLDGIQLLSSSSNDIAIIAEKGIEFCSCTGRSINHVDGVKLPIEGGSSSAIKDYKGILQTGTKKIVAVLYEREVKLYELKDGCGILLHSVSFEKGVVPHRIVPLPYALLTFVVLTNQAPLRVTISRRGNTPVKVEALTSASSAASNVLEPPLGAISKCSVACVSPHGVLYTSVSVLSTLRAVVNPQDSKRNVVVSPDCIDVCDGSRVVSSMASFDSYCVVCCSAQSKAAVGSFSSLSVAATSLLDNITSSGYASGSLSFKHVLAGTSILEALSVDNNRGGETSLNDAVVVGNALNAKRSTKNTVITVVDSTPSTGATEEDSQTAGGVLDKLMDIHDAVRAARQTSTAAASSPTSPSEGRESPSVVMFVMSESADGEQRLLRVADVALCDSLLTNPDCCCVHSVDSSTALLAVGSSISGRVGIYAIKLERNWNLQKRDTFSERKSQVRKISSIDLPEKHMCRGMKIISGGEGGEQTVSLIVMAAKKVQNSASLTSLSTSSLVCYQILSYDLSSVSLSANADVSDSSVATDRICESSTGGGSSSAACKVTPNAGGTVDEVPGHVTLILEAINNLQSKLESRLSSIEARLDRQQKSIDQLMVSMDPTECIT